MDVPTEIRNLIITYHQDGMSRRRIAELVHRPKSTVIDIVRHYNETGSIETLRSGRCGRPRLLSQRDERALARESVANPHLTAREIRSRVGGAAQNASISTVKRALRHQGRYSYRPRKSPSLNKAQRMTRLRWCKKYRVWDATKWRHVSQSVNPGAHTSLTKCMFYIFSDNFL